MVPRNMPAPDRQQTASPNKDAQSATNAASPPTLTLPKGGGAMRGIGEKFAANPVTGTGSMSVPIATSPGRGGFGPQLALAYDSGAGNGPFGLGWNLALPAIMRKTDKGLPQYNDADESDVFILSGAEDLAPVLEQDALDKWAHEEVPPRTVNGVTYRIRSYRPRIEGLFARIERWTNLAKPEDVFWRSISKENTTTWYGRNAESRIVDPADPERIFSWLICETYDDKGNVVVYTYVLENDTHVDQTQANERNRVRTANRYLKRIRYGNHVPYLPTYTPDSLWPVPPDDGTWYFEAIFDYGEHNLANPQPAEPPEWPVRNDPFSSYRSGFEVRTYRLCQRVLMFHHVPDAPDGQQKGYDGLVRSTDFTYEYESDALNARRPIFSKLVEVTQRSYQRTADGYLSASLPPVEFAYSDAIIQTELRELDGASLANLPIGIDGTSYQWVDLDGEGLSGVLTEQANAWFYTRNLSPINVVGKDVDAHIEATFAPIELVATKPALALAGHTQFLDLAGDGRPDVVQFAGSTPGFYERTMDEQWDAFVPFTSLPNLDWSDPNLKFIDLNGDGHADILISEDDALVWHRSLGEAGFAAAQRTSKPWDEEMGPQIVFADGEQAIYLGDMSGDGLTDIVRIRNGEICYWPNLGYGRFGAKVAMDNAPLFDQVDQFDHRRMRLADIDGTGTIDLLYLHRDGVRVAFNQSGNSWSPLTTMKHFPALDNLVGVQALDLLGNGTACLVWSSPLPGDARRSLRYLDLMGGQKPHLLIKTVNNLGAETTIDYAPATKFYVQDKRAGQPWITKLPFPVHVVEKVTVTDKWRKTSFASTYSYHHGYFDGIEREFRGFGRVEQVDVESYGTFEQGNTASPYITPDKTLYQPPIKTITWYHTGAFLGRERILSHFEHEYFPHWLDNQHPGLQITFQENPLPQPDLAAEQLSADEWREALRACKGMLLRQEVYELDVDALERPVDPAQRPVKLFSTAYHNCHIRRLQPQAANRHAVFLVAESEAITYHYELDLQTATLHPDPRIAHTLNLQYDEYANILQSVAVVYPRLGTFEDDANLADGLADALDLIRQVQKEETHIAYSETRYTQDFGAKPAEEVAAFDNHRLRVPCEVLTYELTGISPEDADDRASPDSRDNRYFTLDELRAFQLSLVHQKSGTLVPDIPYHQTPNRATPEKRLVEHVRTLFFAENLVDPLPFGESGRLGLPYETYKLALTEALLNAVFKDAVGNNKLDQSIGGVATARAKLNDSVSSGYLSGAKLVMRFASIPAAELTGQYWIRSGIAGFAPDAAQHFYLPERYTDPFDNVTRLEYDPRDLFVASSTDPLGNTTRVTQFDYRVLAPREMQDINANLSEVYFDVLGLPAAIAIKGKGTDGDNLTGFTDALANPALNELTAFFVEQPFDEAQARAWLGNATARHVYSFGEVIQDGEIVWGQHPACACGILREQHVAQLAPGEQSRLQAAFEYSDGMGSVVVKKVQAEPENVGQLLRWVASGKTILNNKGKPVKQYEPYFTEVGHHYEAPHEEGVAMVMYYDAVGRVVRTEMPDGSYSRVEFSPWFSRRFDANDTVQATGNRWYADRGSPDPATPLQVDIQGQPLETPEFRAAWLAAHHANTPALTILDSLGRDVLAVAHNRTPDANGQWQDERYLTFTKLDAEGKPLWIRDARKNLVMQYIAPPVPSNQPSDPMAGFVPCYDIAGNLLFQHSMDAGERWMVNDAAGKPMLAWNNRGHTFRTDYDALHRPIRSFVAGADLNDPNRECCVEHVIYGEQHPEDTQRNLRGRAYMQLDQAGVVVSDRHDFKGNLLRGTRRLAADHKRVVDWKTVEVALPNDLLTKLNLVALDAALTLLLEHETFSSNTRYDALNRPIQLVAPHSDQVGTKFNVIRPGYNEANLLERVDVWLEQIAEPAALLDPATASLHAVTNIDYDAKGQRIRIEYNQANHSMITEYTYDKATFRLTRLLSTRPKHLEADKRTLQDLSYIYDPVGNITTIGDAAQQTVFFNNSMIVPSNAYVYDALYRLIRAEGREHAVQNIIQRDAKNFEPIIGVPFPNNPEALQRYSENYEYDSVGNILGLHHTGGGAERWVRWYQYALDSNRLLATRLPGEAVKLPFYTAIPGYGAKYPYDAHGNMIAMPHLPTLEWDFKDQLHATQQQVVNNGPGAKTYYVYDAGGQRVRKITETPSGKPNDERIYLGGFEVYRKYNGDGQTVVLERETLHVMDDKQRVALIETRTRLVGADPAPRQLVRYQLSNQLGSASLELDDQAQVISYEEYHPYGTTAYEAARSNTETPKRYRYTGKERDEETGLSYHGARYYAPWLGRWVSADPIGIGDGVNVYAYSHNTPATRHDPSGTQSAVSALDQVATEKHITDDPSFRSYVRQMDANELRGYMKTATLDEGGQAYLNARIASLEAPSTLQQSAKKVLELAGGKNPVVTLVPLVRQQFEALANAEIAKGQTEIEVPFGNTKVALGKEAIEALQVIEHLAEATQVRRLKSGNTQDTLGIASFVRAGAGLHGQGLAFDISSYHGHQFNENNPTESRAAVAGVLNDLPAGHYGFGLPRLSSKFTISENAEHSKKQASDMEQHPADYNLQPKKDWIFTPGLRDATQPVREREDPFFPQPQSPTDFGRFGDTSKLSDLGTRSAISAAAGRNVFVTPFPDGFGHLHLSIVGKGAKAF